MTTIKSIKNPCKAIPCRDFYVWVVVDIIKPHCENEVFVFMRFGRRR